jgi:hypothetical protein
MVCNHPEIAELDGNPLIVRVKGKGCPAAGGRVLRRRPGA